VPKANGNQRTGGKGTGEMRAQEAQKITFPNGL